MKYAESWVKKENGWKLVAKWRQGVRSIGDFKETDIKCGKLLPIPRADWPEVFANMGTKYETTEELPEPTVCKKKPLPSIQASQEDIKRRSSLLNQLRKLRTI
jgi:hypothetical protein